MSPTNSHEPITSKTPTLATRLEAKDRKALERMARANDRSVAAEMRQALKFWIGYMNGKTIHDVLKELA